MRIPEASRGGDAESPGGLFRHGLVVYQAITTAEPRVMRSLFARGAPDGADGRRGTV